MLKRFLRTKEALQLEFLLYLITDIEKNQEFAILEYWLRLRVPMEQALRLYKVDNISIPLGRYARKLFNIACVQICEELVWRNKDVKNLLEEHSLRILLFKCHGS